MSLHEIRLAAERRQSLDGPLHNLSEVLAPHSSVSSAHVSGEAPHYLSLVARRKWLILSVVIIVTTLTGLYAFSLPSIYETAATLRLEPKEYTFMEDNRGTVFRGYDNYEYSNTQVKMLGNTQLMRKVILKLNLQNDPDFLETRNHGSVISAVSGMFLAAKFKPAAKVVGAPAGEENSEVESLPPQQLARMEPYVSALLANLKVEPQESTSLINVRFRHMNPETAFNVLDTLTKTFVESNNKYETAGSEAAAEKLARQLAEVQLTLKNLEQQRIDYLNGHNLPLGQGQGRNLTAERLGTLSAQLLAAENERKNLEAAYESAKSATDIWSIPQVRDSRDMQELQKTIRDLEQKRAALMEVYTTNWPQVRQIDSQLKQLKENIKASASEAIAALKSSSEAAVARESRLREAYYREQAAANHQSRDEVELASLNQQIDTSKQIFNTLFQRQKELEVNSIDKSNRVSIVTPPALPLEPVGPERLSKVIAAFFISLLAGIGLALLLHQFDSRLKSAEDIASHIYLPTLALIPTISSTRKPLGVEHFLGKREVGDKATALTRDLRSLSSEAYRQLRTSLLFNRASAPKSILVTSGLPFEGKTTTAVSMAITFAQTGAEVLLIDCDLRRPQVHSYFGLSNTSGFTDYFCGKLDFEAVVHSYPEHPSLKVLTAGPTLSSPPDFLGSNETRQFVEALKARFEYVIIDSPPAKAFADAAILSTLVDGVIIVVHRDRNSRATVQGAKNRLVEVGARIYGVVLNHANAEAKEYYSGCYSHYYAGDQGD